MKKADNDLYVKNLVIALDQATQKTGISLWDKDNKKLLGYTLLICKKNNTIERIKTIKNTIISLIEEKQKLNLNIEVVLEDIQYQDDTEENKNKLSFGQIKDNSIEKINNVKTFKVLAWLQGVLLIALSELNIKTSTIFASSWKSYCGIKGVTRNVQKQNSINFVKEKFNIQEITSDEADAICIGWTFINQ